MICTLGKNQGWSTDDEKLVTSVGISFLTKQVTLEKMLSGASMVIHFPSSFDALCLV